MLFSAYPAFRDILISLVWRSIQYTGLRDKILLSAVVSPRQFIPIEEPVCQQHATWSSGTGALMQLKGDDGVRRGAGNF